MRRSLRAPQLEQFRRHGIILNIHSRGNLVTLDASFHSAFDRFDWTIVPTDSSIEKIKLYLQGHNPTFIDLHASAHIEDPDSWWDYEIATFRGFLQPIPYRVFFGLPNQQPPTGAFTFYSPITMNPELESNWSTQSIHRTPDGSIFPPLKHHAHPYLMLLAAASRYFHNASVLTMPQFSRLLKMVEAMMIMIMVLVTVVEVATAEVAEEVEEEEELVVVVVAGMTVHPAKVVSQHHPSTGFSLSGSAPSESTVQGCVAFNQADQQFALSDASSMEKNDPSFSSLADTAIGFLDHLHDMTILANMTDTEDDESVMSFALDSADDDKDIACEMDEDLSSEAASEIASVCKSQASGDYVADDKSNLSISHSDMHTDHVGDESVLIRTGHNEGWVVSPIL
ncbi:hypothetical protein CALCODRAFT_482245 [Calocera cornea HHB12733]|uniref:Uncharacterized protein n=1 Tax=Calocera cornea HHB12733 TaxID=1353952 RepID=A0A165GXP0_9BASI|nr:hypothetical protein CALCODRAFT_482245 [Calocera cornea HHB12733]